ncbi:MAG: molybdopterin molybdotransferase MoeA, partial [Armatimonadetes bacterium]|nr:molybdopterin molybdotransferase MoeA [Armatimonadota bacterium]
ATGDEIVPPAATPQPGQVRDLNSYALAAAIQGLGAIPRRLGIIPDDLDALRAAARAGLESSDLLLVSAGSSVGARDLAAGVIQELGEPGVLVHGVDIRPGKPTIFALCSGKPVFGLPGQPVSVLNTFDQFVAPVLRRLLHHSTPPPTVSARLAEAIRSADGREDHVRVALEERSDGWWAHPILGVSAMITTMTRADGMTVIPAGTPGVAAGETVTVRLLV